MGTAAGNRPMNLSQRSPSDLSFLETLLLAAEALRTELPVLPKPLLAGVLNGEQKEEVLVGV